jgi:hypothetical protein
MVFCLQVVKYSDIPNFPWWQCHRWRFEPLCTGLMVSNTQPVWPYHAETGHFMRRNIFLQVRKLIILVSLPVSWCFWIFSWFRNGTFKYLMSRSDGQWKLLNDGHWTSKSTFLKSQYRQIEHERCTGVPGLLCTVGPCSMDPQTRLTQPPAPAFTVMTLLRLSTITDQQTCCPKNPSSVVLSWSYGPIWSS